ncbi:uncharacterized protein [Epargyreus clarus]|uniref:uncharacterized protein n=1 Tax=Epargyreus clarus TaxID=520877 RepID=UPI003C2E46FA
MPPKPKEVVKKPPPPVLRPEISDASLNYVPEDAIDGYQTRIETGIEWTLLEDAGRYHKQRCRREYIPKITFSEALKSKIEKSILNGFLENKSDISLKEQWEIMLPITLWDNEKFANEEGKTCFHSANSITDDIIFLIKKAVLVNDREMLKKDLKMISVLRLNDAEMTNVDESLNELKQLITLNLCGNYIKQIDSKFIPPGLRFLELQANRIANVEGFIEYLPVDLLYLGLGRNFLSTDSVGSLSRLPHHLSVLDLTDNDIYDIEPVLDALAVLPSLKSLSLAGNPCAVCAGYARTTLMRLPHLQWLDSREVLPTDRSIDPFEPHPDDLRATYFNFTVFRIMSVAQPPKPEKGATTAFHVELELPLLDSTRRRFLMYRGNDSLIEMLPPPEDDEWPLSKMPSVVESKPIVDSATSSHESDIYNRPTMKDTREIHHYTTFESNKIQWNKVMNFQEPTVRIFCPDLVALRDTFRTVVTIRLVYTVTYAAKQGKTEKKSALSIRPAGEYRVNLATIRCGLKRPDWSQQSQHFHWDDSLGTNDAIHWGDGDLSIIQYTQAPPKTPKPKQENDPTSSRQMPPDNLTCHFGFGIDTLRA